MADLLRIYLQDHHAGACAGLALARRTAAANRGTRFGDELEAIAAEIAEDRRQLERIMSRVAAKPNRIKDGGARLLERVGRLKPNGRVRSYSPLSRVVELEGLRLGVTGKLALWEALIAAGRPELEDVDIKGLASRAQDQRQRIEDLRQLAIPVAFAPRTQG